MKKLFEDQLKNNNPVKEEVLSALLQRKYHSGKNIEAGDVVLYAFLNRGATKKELSLDLITLNEKEFDLYDIDENVIGTHLPTIKLIN
jgi:hypothetical protein